MYFLFTRPPTPPILGSSSLFLIFWLLPLLILDISPCILSLVLFPSPLLFLVYLSHIPFLYVFLVYLIHPVPGRLPFSFSYIFLIYPVPGRLPLLPLRVTEWLTWVTCLGIVRAALRPSCKRYTLYYTIQTNINDTQFNETFLQKYTIQANINNQRYTI